MWNIAIPAICVIAHVFLGLVFLPGFWREIDRRGFRWHDTVSLFVVPAMVCALIGWHVVDNLGSLSDWLLVVAFITIDALVVAMVLIAVRLRGRRRRVV